MNRTTKVATALTLAGALAVSAATPSFARNGRIAAGVIGFAAGTMLGAAAASAHNGPYYDGAYAYEPGYSGYAYEPGPAYAYEPGYAYEPARPYYRSYNRGYGYGCVSEGAQGRPDYGACK
jgi:hypothetical protein